MAINDKSVPNAIKNLKSTMNFVLLFLMAISIAEYIVINDQFTAINDNFVLVQKSYARIAESQRIA